MDSNAKRCVVIVDDDAESREVLREIVAELGFRVVVAANGREGLNQLRDAGCNSVVLLDLEMPVMDGWQFCEAKRSDPSLFDVPVVILSASGPFQALPEHIDLFLAKPVDFDRLSAALAAYA